MSFESFKTSLEEPRPTVKHSRSYTRCKQTSWSTCHSAPKTRLKGTRGSSPGRGGALGAGLAAAPPRRAESKYWRLLKPHPPSPSFKHFPSQFRANYGLNLFALKLKITPRLVISSEKFQVAPREPRACSWGGLFTGLRAIPGPALLD